MRAGAPLAAALLLAPLSAAALGAGSGAAAGTDPYSTPLLIIARSNLTEGPPLAPITLTIEALFWAVPTDLDEIRATAAGSSQDLTVRHTAIGRYEADAQLPAVSNSSFSSSTSFEVVGRRGDQTYQARAYVSAQRGSLSLIRLNDGEGNAAPGGRFAPGDTVRYELRETVQGVPTDLGAPNITVRVEDGYESLDDDPQAGPRTATRSSVGTYRFDLEVPPDLTVTREYLVQVGVWATPRPDYGGSFLGAHDWVFVRHTPVTAFLQNYTADGADLTVLVGDEDPVPGARVFLNWTSELRYGGVGSFPLSAPTTDAWGRLTSRVSWPANMSYSLRLDVLEGGHTTTWELDLPWASPPPEHTPSDPRPPPEGMFAFAVRADPESPGTLTHRVYVFADGEPLRNASLARVAWGGPYGGWPATWAAGNVTTGADGSFVQTLDPPFLEGYGSAVVSLWEPRGNRTDVGLSGWPSSPADPFLPVKAAGDTLGDPLNVTVRPVAGAGGGANVLYVEARPAGVMMDRAAYTGWTTLYYGHRPLSLSAPLNGSPTNLTGTVSVPYWWPPGEYSVTAYAVTLPEAGNHFTYWVRSNETTVTLGPGGRMPPARPPVDLTGTSQTFIPAPGAFVVTLGVLAAAVAVRRRRVAP